MRSSRVFLSRGGHHAVWAVLSLLLCASPGLCFDLSVRTGTPGQTLIITVTTAPLPASGATVTFSPPGLTASNITNDAAGFLSFSLTISADAKPGRYSSLYRREGATISNPAAFTVVAAGTALQPGWVQVPLPADPVAPPVPPPPKAKPPKTKKKSPPPVRSKEVPPPDETSRPQGNETPPPISVQEFAGLPLGIRPIQVVQDPPLESLKEDIVLVQGKATRVRVVPQLPKGRDRIDDVKCCLSWSGEPEQCITATLVRHQGRVWVLPDTAFVPATPGDASEAERILGWMGNTARAQSLEQLRDKYWAYNFTYGDGRPAPKDSLSLDARLEINGRTVVKARKSAPRDFKLRSFLWNRDRSRRFREG